MVRSCPRGLNDAMPSPRGVLPVLLAFVLATLVLPVPSPAAALDGATFIAKTSAWAQEGERQHGVPASVAIAQSMLESGMGESSLTKNANNWFGIKCSSTTSPYQNGCYSVSTQEYDSNGNLRTTTASFRKYDSPQLSFMDHGHFLSSLSRYARAFSYSNNPDRFIVEVHLGGYATDPQYANKVIGLMVQHDLYRHNVTVPATGAAELVIRPQTRVNVGTTAHVTGLLSPGGGGRAISTQALTPSGWSTSQRVTAGSRGQFSLPLTFGTSTVGVTRFRVQASSAAGVLTSAEFAVERLGSVRSNAVASVWVGQTARLTGSAIGYPGRTVQSQVLVSGAWQNHTSGTVAADGTFDLPLTSGLSSAGTRSVRARLTTSTGVVLVSSSVTATWLTKVSVTAFAADAKAVGQTTHTWGTATGAPNAEVWTEVQVSGRWSRSQTTTTDSAGRFTIRLTYGASTLGPQVWRVAVRTSLGVFYSRDFTITRVQAPIVTAFSAGTKPVGQDTFTWGSAPGAPGAEVWTEVQLESGWVRSRVGTTSSTGAFTLPLTYGSHTLGAQSWRVVVRNSTGIFYSNQFTLLREPAPVTVRAQSAGTKRVGEITFAWGTALGAPEAQVWTEVALTTGWSRSRMGLTDAAGRFVLPLTYGSGTAGTHSWRVGVRSLDGVFYSPVFTLTRLQ